ncbi:MULTISPECIES: hypothetical protein [Burkholderia]|uniref:hypothetical protein n=1 Tax=Burkholderia TaxID=32008 RepID=UPI000754B640|nr:MULTISPECIES: hypothetical protein [Burkholderia]AOJ72227.1 hypothetical protein WS78_26230 [Burkholderia savannae]KVG44285.1 hypothetical protein WS77_10155 [Burkholderia sp. MSMB0265]KVG87812.1 hypothetical protein WS81_26135 [Burkholderia sp. MSMB2040]KVG96342.1 hypothetical protein WS83_03005 [Burkholderia sp. MSMB2042]KVG97214.1 hypothetical protein WS82_30365 [Burkholderia sp. MSMB2041]
MGKTLMHSKNFREAERQSKQQQSHELESLHQQASKAFAEGRIGEYVEDIPGWPWFAAIFGELEMTAAYYPTDNDYVVMTVEQQTILRSSADAGLGPVMAFLQRLYVAQSASEQVEGV